MIDFNALLIPSPCMRATEINCNNTKLRFKLWKFVFFFLWVCIKILFILMIYICDSSLIRLLLKYLISGCSSSFLLLLFSFLNYSLYAFYITLESYNRFVSLQNKDRVHYVRIYVIRSFINIYIYIYIMSTCLGILLFFGVKVNNLHLL